MQALPAGYSNFRISRNRFGSPGGQRGGQFPVFPVFPTVGFDADDGASGGTGCDPLAGQEGDMGILK
jgi:hypothetical protein